MNFWISSDTWLLNVPCLKQSCGKHFFPIQKASKHQAIYFPKSYYPSTRHGCHTEKFTFHWIGICLISQFLRIQTASWKSQNSDCSLKARGSLCIFFFFHFCFVSFPIMNAILSLAQQVKGYQTNEFQGWYSTHTFLVFSLSSTLASWEERFCYLSISKHYSFLFLESVSKYLSKYLLAFFLISFILEIFFWLCWKELDIYFANPNSLVAIKGCYDL